MIQMSEALGYRLSYYSYYISTYAYSHFIAFQPWLHVPGVDLVHTFWQENIDGWYLGSVYLLHMELEDILKGKNLTDR